MEEGFKFFTDWFTEQVNQAVSINQPTQKSLAGKD